MSQKDENKKNVDPCFLAWVHLLEILEKEEAEEKKRK